MLIIACSCAFLYVGSTRFVVVRNLEKATSAGFINSMIGAAGVTGDLLGAFSEFWLSGYNANSNLSFFSGFLLFKILNKAS